MGFGFGTGWGPLLLVAALMALAGGCKVDQQKEVATYQKVLELPSTRPSEGFVRGEPLSLRQAMRLANRHDEELSIEGENYLQALITKKRVVAAFLPRADLTPTWENRDRGYPHEKRTGGGQLDVPVSANINLFNGFRDLAALESAKFTAEERKLLLLSLQESVLQDVARVYYQILRAERSVEVLKTSLAVQEARVRDVRGRRDAGTARPLDVAQSESQASATRVDLITAQNDVKDGRNVLAFLTHAAVQESVLVTDSVPIETQTYEQYLEQAMREREDLRAARQAVLAAEQDVKVAVGEYYPSVTLNFDYFLHRDSVPSVSDWTALLSANLPIFTGGAIEADVRLAWSRLRQACLNETLLRREIERDVELAYEDLGDSGKRLDELRTEVTAAEQAFNQADKSYAIGLATNLERLVAQQQMLSAQLRLASEVYGRQVFYLDLLRASGRLVDTIAADGPDGAGPTTRPVVNGAATGRPSGHAAVEG